MDENEIISNECLHIINGDYNENTKLTQEFNYLIKKPNSIFILLKYIRNQDKNNDVCRNFAALTLKKCLKEFWFDINQEKQVQVFNELLEMINCNLDHSNIFLEMLQMIMNDELNQMLINYLKKIAENNDYDLDKLNNGLLLSTLIKNIDENELSDIRMFLIDVTINDIKSEKIELVIIGFRFIIIYGKNVLRLLIKFLWNQNINTFKNYQIYLLKRFVVNIIVGILQAY